MADVRFQQWLITPNAEGKYPDAQIKPQVREAR
jgi:hypothetical protein